MLSEISNEQFVEWMAFDRLKDQKFKNQIEQESRTPEEQEAWIMKQLAER